MSEKMNPEIKKRWVEALRSGRHKQGRRQLQMGDTYCCLGVLAELVFEEMNIPHRVTGYGAHAYGQKGNEASLPMEICIPLRLGPLGDLPNGNKLALLNDEGATFKEIADIIEEQL